MIKQNINLLKEFNPLGIPTPYRNEFLHEWLNIQTHPTLQDAMLNLRCSKIDSFNSLEELKAVKIPDQDKDVARVSICHLLAEQSDIRLANKIPRILDKIVDARNINKTIGVYDKGAMPLLHRVIMKGDVNLVKQVLEKKADPNTIDKQFQYAKHPLILAQQANIKNKDEIIVALASRGSDPFFEANPEKDTKQTRDARGAIVNTLTNNIINEEKKAFEIKKDEAVDDMKLVAECNRLLARASSPVDQSTINQVRALLTKVNNENALNESVSIYDCGAMSLLNRAIRSGSVLLVEIIINKKAEVNRVGPYAYDTHPSVTVYESRRLDDNTKVQMIKLLSSKECQLQDPNAVSTNLSDKVKAEVEKYLPKPEESPRRGLSR